MLAEWLTVLGCGTLLFGLAPKAPTRPDPRDLDIVSICARVHRLEQTAARIDSLDRMIADVSMCEPEVLHRNFSCAWTSGDTNSRYDFWTTGADMNADHLLQMAADERAALLTSLLDQIEDLSALRWQKNGRKTFFRHALFTAGEGRRDGD